MKRFQVLLGWMAVAVTSPFSTAAEERALEPMQAQVWMQNYRSYLEQSESMSPSEAVSKSAEAHFKLGQWAWRHGLEDEAWEQWVKALALDPDHAPTREATGFVHSPEGWVRPGQLNPTWIEQLKADGRALSFTFAIQDDADAVFFEELKWRLRRLNWFLWQITEGQLYLEKVEVADRTPGGRFTVPEGQLDIPVMAGGGAHCLNPGKPDWRVISGGRCYVRILAHELLHGIFGLPDERAGCYCLMQGGLYGIKTTDLELCDDDSHRHHEQTPHSCWSLIQQRYPRMVHPNPVDFGRAPEVEITVQDR